MPLDRLGTLSTLLETLSLSKGFPGPGRGTVSLSNGFFWGQGLQRAGNRVVRDGCGRTGRPGGATVLGLLLMSALALTLPRPGGADPAGPSGRG